MKYVVYAIVDPRDQRIFYIGETGDFERRKAQHLEGTDQLSGLMVRMIRENGLLPLFVVLEHCPSEEAALMAEMFWIETFKARGARLDNSQAFNGHAAREGERRARVKALEGLQRAKYDGRKLRDVANGRSYQEQAPCPPSRRKKWSKRELARLRGMRESGLPAEVMAQLLECPVPVVRAKLKEL